MLACLRQLLMTVDATCFHASMQQVTDVNKMGIPSLEWGRLTRGDAVGERIKVVLLGCLHLLLHVQELLPVKLTQLARVLGFQAPNDTLTSWPQPPLLDSWAGPHGCWKV